VIRRRAAGLLLTGFLLHLNLAAADPSCTNHSSLSPGLSAGEALPSHVHHQALTSGDAPLNKAPCQIPVQPNCCQSLASCFMDALAVGVRSATIPDGASAITQSVSEIPLSPAASPDPPPPKA
jgi:hypothetical protein